MTNSKVLNVLNQLWSVYVDCANEVFDLEAEKGKLIRQLILNKVFPEVIQPKHWPEPAFILRAWECWDECSCEEREKKVNLWDPRDDQEKQEAIRLSNLEFFLAHFVILRRYQEHNTGLIVRPQSGHTRGTILTEGGRLIIVGTIEKSPRFYSRAAFITREPEKDELHEWYCEANRIWGSLRIALETDIAKIEADIAAIRAAAEAVKPAS